ncbi:hypothetical protein ASPZODRAFT_70711 [Penicilliopsis zonata CBS 506.65]|uniref:Spherulin 4-like cell surface protein n=1 Tax=Penicilliopsis zonata CBS 506.65 TaxID=1073090 RepID=A0A1L9SCS8_9EURO|nr:hypothetical protein ASPZODRAFT_70711 [Penicilliopsis zonata CBS 506.65]OJJ45020.1 hypothetical protein ASPZODRAFT_70711 [Penicilliopsis zonata CBS 506.65]
MIAIIVTLVVICLVALITPLAVLLPHHHPKRATVLFPLYIYPDNSSTWAPLFKQLDDYPTLNFTVVVNPDSGPGDAALPSQTYITQIERLNSYDNVQTVGYVRTRYATRNITVVEEEVGVYARWADNSSSLAMDGIFFDEVPSTYSAAAETYLNTIDAKVRAADGLNGNMVIHNPGTIPSSEFSTTANVTVVAEISYSKYLDTKSELAAMPSDRSKYAYLLHSMPSMTVQKLHSFLDTLDRRAEYLFVTTLSSNYYESFGPDLALFCDAMPTGS